MKTFCLLNPAIGFKHRVLRAVQHPVLVGSFLTLVLLAPVVICADETPSQTQTPQVATYDELLKAIRAARAATQAAVEQAKVREAWETGRLIDQHVLQHKERAEYGAQVVERLASDLGSSATELKYMLQFARAYPIRPTSDELTWSDYRELLSLNDPAQREEVSRKAAAEKWDVQKIRSEVKRLRSETGPAGESGPVPLVAVPGKPGTYRYIKATVGPEAGRNVIDLGFSNYYRTSKDLGFKDGAIMESLPAFPEASSPSDRIKLSKRTADDLYTYKAWIVNVLDGDTVKAVIDLGFGVRSVQVLRLRAIDCPELSTPEGQEAKKFVENILIGDSVEGIGDRKAKTGDPVIAPVRQGMSGGSGAKQSVLIKTIKSDKYDRYLADIFIPKTSDQGQATSDFIYLNNQLLEQGHAVRVQD